MRFLLDNYMKDDPLYCVCGCSSFYWNLKRVFIKFFNIKE